MPEEQTGPLIRPGRPEPTLKAGAIFDKYEIIRPLGSGGMGAVYEAKHKDLNKRVAVKVLHRHVAEMPEVRTRFMREGQASIRIRHPHVVDVSDVGESDGMPYLVMEFLEGEDLASLIEKKGALSVDTTLSIAFPVLSAVAAAHDANIIHRDLKPENVFLRKTRVGYAPKLLDFGISKVTNDPTSMGLTGTGMLLGTPYYMPPEQARGGKNVDARADQYALGVVLYECLVGSRPFVADTLFELLQLIVEGSYPHLRERKPEVPEGLAAVIERAMHKTAAERFPDVLSFGVALLPFASAQLQAMWTSEFDLRGSGERAMVALSSASVPPPRASDPPAANPSVPPQASAPVVQGGSSPPASLSGTFQASVRSVESTQRKPALLGAGLALAVAVVGGGVWFARHRSAVTAPTAAVHSVAPSPSSAPAVPTAATPSTPVAAHAPPAPTPPPPAAAEPVAPPLPPPTTTPVAAANQPTPPAPTPPAASAVATHPSRLAPAPDGTPHAQPAHPHLQPVVTSRPHPTAAPELQRGANGAPIVQ